MYCSTLFLFSFKKKRKTKMTKDAYDGIKLLFKLITDVFFREIKVR